MYARTLRQLKEKKKKKKSAKPRRRCFRVVFSFNGVWKCKKGNPTVEYFFSSLSRCTSISLCTTDDADGLLNRYEQYFRPVRRAKARSSLLLRTTANVRSCHKSLPADAGPLPRPLNGNANMLIEDDSRNTACFPTSRIMGSIVYRTRVDPR